MAYYDIIFITNQPAFYKVRLWNEVCKKKKILAIFTSPIEKDRNTDFVSEQQKFDYKVLSGNVFKKTLSIFLIIKETCYKELIIGGWETLPIVFSAFCSPRTRNAIICESSIYEFHAGLLKKIFLYIYFSRFSKALPAGIAQKKIFEKFKFSGKINTTGGCGILNYTDTPTYTKRATIHNFLYVGRLTAVKNLKLLIEVFNGLPQLHLDIIGFGDQEKELKKIAGSNITFLGTINNKELSSYYLAADVFILPSSIEPWGLVIEEALNHGTPVIISDMVGCKDDLINYNTGIIFEHNSYESLKKAILQITNVDFYNSLRLGVSKVDFKARAQRQINTYISN